jgi:putative protease
LRISGNCQPWFVPRAQIKELKRRLGQAAAGRFRDFIDEKRRRATDAVIDLPAPVELGKKQSFAVKVDRLESLDAVLAYARQNPDFPLDEILFEPKRAFLPNSGPALRPEDLAERLVASVKASGIALRLALPTVVRQWDETQLRLWFTAGASAGINRYEVGNLGGLQLLKDWNLWNDASDVAGDFTLYALNAQAALFWAEQGLRQLALSIEDDRDNIECTLARWPHRTGLRPQAILFKDTPLFIAEACSLTALHNGCPTGKVCGYRTLEIEGPTGERFFVGHESCKSIVYGREAYSITQNREWLAAAGIRDFRLDFLTRPYTPEQIAAVLDAAAKNERIAGTHSANFERSLL